MRLEDLTVEVRDGSLTRLGVIRPEELDFRMEDRFNNVGTWKLTLAAEHPMVPHLKEPGAGIIVTGPSDVLMSGPTNKPEFQATPGDPLGTITFEGVSDTVILADALSYPTPTTGDVTAQVNPHDVRTGPAETLLHEYVNANIGPGAVASRRKANLIMGTDEGRGATLTKRPRFPVLGNLLYEIAVTSGLGFRVVQRGDNLVFETYVITDRTREIRLDVANNTLSGSRVALSAPTATRIIVAGQGEQEERKFLQVDNADSIAAETAWGRRIERFVDQRNTNEDAELTKAGEEVLAEEGFTAVAVQAVPNDDIEGLMRYGVDWGLGDAVTVVIHDTEYANTVTGFVIICEPNSFKVGAILGDPTKFDPEAALQGRVTDTARRVSELERNLETTNDLAAKIEQLETDLNAALGAAVPVGVIQMWPTASPPTGWLVCDGSTFDVLSYPELNTVLGGNTLPNMQDRAPVGASGSKAVLSVGGNGTVILTATELPAHYHAVNINTGYISANHVHGINYLLKTNDSGGGSAVDNGSSAVAQGKTGGRFNASQTGETNGVNVNHTHNVSGNTGWAGSGGAFSVQNPYVALNFIIKAA